jgi:hypothetical protein
MLYMNRLPFALSAAVLAGVFSGCASDAPNIYQQEKFSDVSQYAHDYSASAANTCEAARRALLSQGYVIDKAQPAAVDATKSFQQSDKTHMEIEFHIVCAPNGPGGKESTAFASALQDRYVIKKSSNAASVGVGAFGAISLPFGTNEDSLVKIASQTIPAGQFYDRFFSLVDYYLVLDTGELPAHPSTPHVKK